MTDPLVAVLHDHMRVAVEDGEVIKCWCDERFEGGTAHREHVARIIRETLANETKEVE